MRIEGEKGVKTQSAPNHWPRTRKEIWPSKFQPGRPYRSSREGTALLGRTNLARQNRPRRRTTEGNRPLGRICIGTDRPYGRSGNKRSASADFSSKQFGRPNRSTATKIHRPSAQTFRPR
ncbi:unnamed protein product [Microthlaspi erraticum]|uniref:Uncharacterized protein n=1 Tax=Microthlaspi erraticum TaxID=1685480 RepID=A0A6D2JYH2_9BRAS|nr:unnamed protein product [Microthlaspi erraticum]